MRVVSTRVLPLPAPASTKAGAGGQVTAANCSGFSPCNKEDEEFSMAAIVADGAQKSRLHVQAVARNEHR